MVTSQKSLKFKVQNEDYKENIIIQLERITNQEQIKVKDDKVTNYFILVTRKQNKVGNK